jgi:branched-chain amino acid transport system ATP-binding protein
MTSPILEVRDLRAGYGSVEILRGISLHVNEGELVALLGSNGAGKTTLNHALCGLLSSKSGQVIFAGSDLSRAHYTKIVQAGLIQVPEGRKVFPDLSVSENLDLGAYERGAQNLHVNKAKVLEIFPRLKERMGQLAGTMSGGEQQMLAIGRALMSEPKLLILDEPSLGLSPKLVQEMFDLIERLRGSGLSILLVEQNVGQSLEIAERAYVLENGSIKFEGVPSELLASDAMRKAYLGV